MAPLSPSDGRRGAGAGRSAAGRAAAPLPVSALRASGTLALGAFAALGLGACAGLPPPPLLPEPIPYADTLPIPEPETRSYSEPAELFQTGVMDAVGTALEVRRWAGAERPALNLTRDDDVVSSAWFAHRNGRAEMEPAAVRGGAATAPGPDTERPLEVVRAKETGIQPGLWVRDARGDSYLLKLDPVGYPHLSSAADVVTSRLLHAAGYHVPANYKVAFHVDRLVPARGEAVEGDGETVEAADAATLTREEIERELASGARLPDGRVVALASRAVPGEPKGPWRFQGRRPDDPNDHYRHEHRRELRGLHVVAAWLNHVDLRFANTLDVWIDPPGYLRHYLVDFGSSLGSGGVRPNRPREGREHNFDVWASALRLVSLGFYRAGWEAAACDWAGGEPDRERGATDRVGGCEPVHPAVGRLPGQEFRPDAWKPNWPNAAWRSLTPADGYWGAKLVASFSDAQIAAAVEAADLPPAAARALARTLAVRRDRTVAHWFTRVTPLERPAVEPAGPHGGERRGFTLSFDDRGLGLPAVGPTRYRWELRHDALGRRWKGAANADGAGRQRIAIGPLPGRAAEDGPRGSVPDRDDARAYARLSVVAEREGAEGRPATLWLLWRGPGEGYAVAAMRH